MNLKHCIKRSLGPVDADRRAAFEDQLDRSLRQGSNAAIRYDLPYPKYEFLNYLCDEKGLVGHGSSMSDLITLEPVRRSEDVSEFGNRRQVFSSADGIWAMWFAILDKTKLQYGTINGCFTLLRDSGDRHRFYYYAIDADSLRQSSPYGPGVVYLAEADRFPNIHRLPFTAPPPYQDIHLEEYGSDAPVRPVAHLHVEPLDFPHLDQVWGYDPSQLSERVRTDLDNIPWLYDESVYPIRPEPRTVGLPRDS